MADMELLKFTPEEQMAIRIVHEKFVSTVEAICRSHGLYASGDVAPGFVGFIYASPNGDGKAEQGKMIEGTAASPPSQPDKSDGG